ncbi:thioredoxin family protein [Microbacterium sp. DT81.1]|uniref:thioredoxin family protein n=1 Tax=Microbacterium sp. DT81.1 TaxID=3393413 RepID=UPI003CECCD73
MNIEVLHIEDCPSWIEAGSRLSEALDATGFGETTIMYRLLGTSADAAHVPFAGSPTITVDGQDLFPSGGRTVDLACRVYLTPTGLAGLPTTEQLIAAIDARGR